MFRWLKDRNKKTRKCFTGSNSNSTTTTTTTSSSSRSKEDDYGFKQNAPGESPPVAPAAAGEYKRDLPPTPADLMTSCTIRAVTSASGDDDRSVHIYEEIPDLPFRCTPEGELRVMLAQEAATTMTTATTKLTRSVTPAWRQPASGAGARNISPYMVVPLEFRADHSQQLRGSGPRPGRQNPPQDGGGGAPPFACALVGRKRTGDSGRHPQHHQHQHQQPGGPATASPSRDSTCSPVSGCSGSSVFGSTPDGAGRWGPVGGDGGDITDRLLNAINLTRLLAAVRLSSSSADTCTTSPICIGVDKDGRNISVSVSVTPTSACSNNSTPANNNNNGSSHCPQPPPHHHHHHHHRANGDNDGSSRTTADEGDITARSALAVRGQQATAPDDSERATPALEDNAAVSESRGSGVFRAQSFEPRLAGSTSSGTSTSTSTAKPESAQHQHHRHHQPGLRFLPSPLEQNALSEILQLRPGETTELDPAAIDALLLKLCSHSSDGAALGEGKVSPSSSSSLPQGSSLQRHELEDVERMLKEMVRRSEAEEAALHHHHHHHHHPVISSSASTSALYSRRRYHHRRQPHGQSPGGARRRAENSDTGFEYDVSTSSESEHTNYDYFLSKVARTRSLEREVKKLIRCSDSSHADSDDEDDDDDDDDEEEEEDDREEEKRVPRGKGATKRGGAGDASLGAAPTQAGRRPSHGDDKPRCAEDGEGTTSDSDDGTMADLSESENSSGYYEPVPNPGGDHRAAACCSGPAWQPPSRLCSYAKKRKVSGPAPARGAASEAGNATRSSRRNLVAVCDGGGKNGKKISAEAVRDDAGKAADGGCDGPTTVSGSGGRRRSVRVGPLGGAEERKKKRAVAAAAGGGGGGGAGGGGAAGVGGGAVGTPGGDRRKSSPGGQACVASERRRALLYGTTTTTTTAATAIKGRNKKKKPSGLQEAELGDLELQCYELYYSGADPYGGGHDPAAPTAGAPGPVDDDDNDDNNNNNKAQQDQASSSADYSLAQIYAPLSDLQRSLTAPDCLSTPPRPSRHAHHLPRSSSASLYGSSSSKPHHRSSAPRRNNNNNNGENDNVITAPEVGARESRKDTERSASGRKKKPRDPSRARGSHARSSSLGDGGCGGSRSDGECCQLRRGSADAASLGGGRRWPGGSALSTGAVRSCHYYHYSRSSVRQSAGTVTAAAPNADGNVGNPSGRPSIPFRPGAKAPPCELSRTASFHSDYRNPITTTTTTATTAATSTATSSKAGDNNNVVYESRGQASEASGSSGAGGIGGGGGGVGAGVAVVAAADGGGASRSSVPSKLSVARQVPESSEVYGTRAGLVGSNNRLLSDLILLNYNRQVLNM